MQEEQQDLAQEGVQPSRQTRPSSPKIVMAQSHRSQSPEVEKAPQDDDPWDSPFVPMSISVLDRDEQSILAKFGARKEQTEIRTPEEQPSPISWNVSEVTNFGDVPSKVPPTGDGAPRFSEELHAGRIPRHEVHPLSASSSLSSVDFAHSTPVKDAAETPTKTPRLLEKIDGRRFRNGRTEYLLKWRGCPDEESTWVPEGNVNCAELVQKYEVERAAREEGDCVQMEHAQKKTKDQPRKLTHTTQASPDTGLESGYYEVEEVLGRRIRRRRVEYLVKWKGYSNEENSWEPESHLNCPLLIQAYERSKESKRSMKTSEKKTKNQPRKLTHTTQASPDTGLEADYYEVEEILGRRVRRRRVEYLVKWKGYSKEENSWVPKGNLNCAELVQKYEVQQAAREEGDCVQMEHAQKKTKNQPRKLTHTTQDSPDTGLEPGYYEVEEVLGRRIRRRRVEYLVKWKGYSKEESSWVPESHLNSPLLEACQDFIRTDGRTSKRSKQKTTVKTSEDYGSPQGTGSCREPEEITGAIRKRGETLFMVKWKDSDENGFIPDEVAKAEYPQLVIDYYEKRIFLPTIEEESD